MRVVLQRVKQAKVTVESDTVGEIDQGYVLFVGITHEDTEEDVEYVAQKVANLRLFEDEEGKMNISLLDSGGSVLSVSQFTLFADTRKGRRPNFTKAAKPEQANALYELFNEKLRSYDIVVETGSFGAMMDVSLVNDGPVTIFLDSKDR